MKTKQGFCHCCGKKVTLLYHEEVGESVCSICRSYDVTVQVKGRRVNDLTTRPSLYTKAS